MGWLMNKTETVTLMSKKEVGKDGFNAPIFEETEIEIKNVLIGISNLQSSSVDVVDSVNLTGKKVTYELCIPKNDDNTWENRDVIIRGQRFSTVGCVREWINPPLDWNRKITVERYE